MALVVTGTFGLVVWIVLWALNVSGFDALLIGIVLVLIVTAIRNVAIQLSRKDQ
jgi:xanthine/uracil/vitamin C permease (AzgA family)